MSAGFAQLLHAEWTKFRTVRGWVIGVVVAVLLIVGLGLFTASGSVCSDMNNKSCPAPPVGPGGQAVKDTFYFVHQPLAGNGSITAHLTSLTGRYSPGGIPVGGPNPSEMRKGLQDWAKVGVMVKANTKPGSAYAAMMLTGGHGVRMQYDFTHDTAGPGGRWLRLTRAGDLLTGYVSTDGSHWNKVGAANLKGLGSTVQIGLFAATPDHAVMSRQFGGARQTAGPAVATGVFDHVSRPGPWHAETVGNDTDDIAGSLGSFTHNAGSLTVNGSGDIAPMVDGQTFEQTLVGAFAGLIALVVVGAAFVTAEYRRGLIRTTLAASPRRGRVLVAKAIVIGGVSFVAALVAIAAVVPPGNRILRSNGNPLLPLPFGTEVRMIAGTAGMLAVAAVLALAVGAIFRRSAGAITAVVAAIVLPFILASANAVPVGAAEWLMRLTPAAAFSVQQALPRYSQVVADYTPGNGYYPLPPWAGFAVLCGYALAALGLAGYLIRRRDA
jgi:ABC-type transport system involved in multi-copper enzyme maturation permease subunit